MLLKLLLEKLIIYVNVRTATFYPSVPVINVIPKIVKHNYEIEKSKMNYLKVLMMKKSKNLTIFLKVLGLKSLKRNSLINFVQQFTAATSRFQLCSYFIQNTFV